MNYISLSVIRSLPSRSEKDFVGFDWCLLDGVDALKTELEEGDLAAVEKGDDVSAGVVGLFLFFLLIFLGLLLGLWVFSMLFLFLLLPWL